MIREIGNKKENVRPNRNGARPSVGTLNFGKRKSTCLTCPLWTAEYVKGLLRWFSKFEVDQRISWNEDASTLKDSRILQTTSSMNKVA